MIEDIDAIRKRFRDNLTTLGLNDGQVIMANAPARNVDEKALWVLFQVNPGDADERGIGETIRVERLGFAILQIHIPKGIGQRSAYDLAEKFNRLFFMWKDVGENGWVRCSSGYARIIENDGAFQLNAYVPYRSVRHYGRASA